MRYGIHEKLAAEPVFVHTPTRRPERANGTSQFRLLNGAKSDEYLTLVVEKMKWLLPMAKIRWWWSYGEGT